MARFFVEKSKEIVRVSTMECKKEENKKMCTCSYDCPKSGICCECVKHHVAKRQVPACFFPPDAEKTYDRSFEHFARLVNEKKV